MTERLNNESNSDKESGWDRGFDEHRVRQLARWARLPFEKKLEWLENATELAAWLQQAAKAARKQAGGGEQAKE